MNSKVESVMKGPRGILLLVLLALGIGATFILLIHENPLEVYVALSKGAFVGKLKIDTTLANFTSPLLTSIAFAVAAKARAFNVDVEGEVFLGGMVAAYVGIYCTWLPKSLPLTARSAAAVAAGAVWAWIPGLLKAYYSVSEVCTTVLMNSMILYIISYLVSGSISADVTNPQSIPVNVMLPKLLEPSNANARLSIATAAVIAVIQMLNKTTLGYKIRTAGTNPANAEYTGINPKRVFIRTMMFSGAIGGPAGCIGVLGTYRYFLDNLTTNLGANGMLASLIVKNDMVTAPFITFSLAVLRSGTLGMQQDTDVLKSIVDTTTTIFAVVAIMELLFQFNKKRKAKTDMQQEEDICNSIKFLISH